MIMVMIFMTACTGGGANSNGSNGSKGSNNSEKSNQSSDSSSEEKGEITVFTRTGPESGDYLRAQAEAFTEATGIKVNFTEQGKSGYFTNLTNQLVAGTDTFDVAATNSAFVGPIAAAGALEPMDDYIAKLDPSYDMDDLAFSYKYDGKTMAIPYDISVQMLYYRKDLIENPPQTWEEYYDVAKQWTKSLNPDSPTEYGTSWTALAGPEQPKTFYSMMWSYGAEIVKDGKAGVGSDGAIEAAKIWQNAMNDGIIPPETPNWGFPNVLDALKTGTIAMAAPMWSAAYNMIISSDSPYNDKIGIAVVPGVEQADGSIKKTPFTHGWSLIMNKQAKNKDDAWKFIEFVTNNEGQMREAKLGGVPARYSVLNDPSLEPRVYYEALLDSMKQARYEPMVGYYLKQHDIMNKALSGIITRTAEPESAMKAAEKELQSVIDEQ